MSDFIHHAFFVARLLQCFNFSLFLLLKVAFIIIIYKHATNLRIYLKSHLSNDRRIIYIRDSQPFHDLVPLRHLMLSTCTTSCTTTNLIQLAEVKSSKTHFEVLGHRSFKSSKIGLSSAEENTIF